MSRSKDEKPQGAVQGRLHLSGLRACDRDQNGLLDRSLIGADLRTRAACVECRCALKGREQLTGWCAGCAAMIADAGRRGFVAWPGE